MGKRDGVILGSIIATIIASTPLLFNLYESVPEIKVWDTYFFTYHSNYYQNIMVLAWTLTGKIVPLFLILIWFFTCRHWWYHALLVPIVMYLFQIFSIINEDITYIDKFQLLHLVPIMAIVIPSIYLIRAKMFDKINTADKTLEDLEEEFTVRPKNVWGKVKQYF
ncbi:hypothetical protein KO494_03565 [Lacinutrix sp. C3R15]|uniref:hypothetical protein n=1 Tax=Flavobacteriaceae TaxID=49546 RepID=UPI001C094E0E|nr:MULTISPECIES: hypothetical protein [Flavobacteriaceae]MBU2938611.1 hypothetical protein [Lacinutrix sp. C3R15]MDO6621925.1 hypothetical protein [Oceanihabitans sp. 1_MG-2023]